MKPEATTVTVNLSGGKTISFETGKLAKQAHGSVVVRLGENVVLATATARLNKRTFSSKLNAHDSPVLAAMKTLTPGLSETTKERDIEKAKIVPLQQCVTSACRLMQSEFKLTLRK